MGQTGTAGPDGDGQRVSRLTRFTADATGGYGTAVAGSAVTIRIGDVGGSAWDQAPAGADFGWPCYEGGAGGSMENIVLASFPACQTYYAGNSAVAPADARPVAGTLGGVTVDFGLVNHTIAAGRSLVVHVGTADASDDALWFAYDTTGFNSRLTIN